MNDVSNARLLDFDDKVASKWSVVPPLPGLEHEVDRPGCFANRQREHQRVGAILRLRSKRTLDRLVIKLQKGQGWIRRRSRQIAALALYRLDTMKTGSVLRTNII